MTLSANAIQQLEVTHPLCHRNLINARLDAVSEILESMSSFKTSKRFANDEGDTDIVLFHPEVNHVLDSVLTTLGRSPDIQRGITRIFHHTATASEFISVIQAILVTGKQLQQLHVEEEEKHVQSKAVRSLLLKKLILTASSSSVINSAAKILSGLNKEAADQRDLPNLFIISEGRFPEVSKARRKVRLATDKLDSLIGIYRKQLRMHNMEFMSVSGTTHLIELPLEVKVPSNWVQVNSTKETIRYHAPEVLLALDQLSLANEALTLVCRAAWDNFLKEFNGYYSEFHAAVQALAALNCLHSLALLSRNKNYVRPVFVNDSEPVQICIGSGRHPVMETLLQDNFVPNDTCLRADGEYCQIVTGPNMGGKSCYILQVALIAIMAQVGSFVQASSAKLHVLDGIHTRMGASDSIQQGRSTFLEELSEACHILSSCSAQSLVIVDELGRGTSTHDGVAIAYATLQYLLEQKRCMTLLVTHYPEIVGITNEFPRSVGSYHVSYLTSLQDSSIMDKDSNQNREKMDYEDVIYLYKLVHGSSERSFGFKVAQLAQLPSSCINRAIDMASKLEAAVSNRGRNRSGDICFGEAAPHDEAQVQDNPIIHTDNICAGGSMGLEELTNACRKVFLNLNMAYLEGDDPAKSFQSLEHARRLAVELINR